ncbi:cytochrome P450 [Achaetomium macrosporum]|uniref:Cytochrome P450 monooxygenase ABA1 n=1 Tax=Achaetomium macrosporum TaxID=79813 RepID=A0AAN7C3V8_9PEZI|nr:cytochrome P450 [Achaetomium macrosporum]
MTLLETLIEYLIEYRWSLLVWVTVLYAVREVLRYHRLRHFRGPWATAFSSIPHRIATYTGESHNWYREVSERYGPIARVGPTSLITSDIDVWMHINTKPGYKRSDWYFKPVRIEYHRDNLFSQTDTKLHDERRKQIAPGYSGRENLELESTIDTLVLDFINLIRTKYLSTPSSSSPIIPLEIAKKIPFFTLDVISAVSFGRAFGMLRADEDIDHYVRLGEQGLRLNNTLMALGLGWLVKESILGKVLGPKPTDTSGFGAMQGACFRYVDDRVRNVKDDTRRDMLASFIRHGLRGDELRSEVLLQLIAGSDTTAGALRGILLYVMAHKRVCVKLQEEIDAAVREGKVDGGEDGVVSFAAAKQLPYLQAVIREGLRIWPPVRNILPKDVPPGGDMVMVQGKPVFLPGGVDIGVSTLAMHRDKKVYGEDADMFRPERWFEPDQERLAVMTRVNNLTFGYGRWECLGKNVAQMELNKVIFELFRRFDLAIANPPKPWEIMNTMGIFVANNMLVQVTAR